MTEKNKLPEVPSTALRDHATDERVDRIWQRLEGNLGAHRPRQPRALLWAPAALLIVFGAGVFVGARWVRPTPGTTAVTAEPVPAGDGVSRPAQRPLTAEPARPDEPAQGRDKKPLGGSHSGLLGSERAVEPGVDPGPPTAVLPPVVAAQPEWEALAENAEYGAAWKALDKAGGFDAVLGKASSASQLMTLYDVAKASGQTGPAMTVLRTVMQKFPKDPRAAIAAAYLASMLKAKGDLAGAAQAYAAYRALSPKGDFAEDALATQIEAAIAQGDVEQAKQLSEQYAKDFPKGSKLRALRARVGKLAGEDAGAAAGDHAPADDTPFDEVEDEPGAKSQKPASQPALAKPAPKAH
jgi:TolA-binding protein